MSALGSYREIAMEIAPFVKQRAFNLQEADKI